MPDIEGLKEIMDIEKQVAAETANLALAYNNAQLAAARFGEEIIQAGMNSEGSMKDFARIAVQIAKKVIATYIATGIASAIKGALTNVPFPFNILAAGVATGSAAALFEFFDSGILPPEVRPLVH